MKFQGSDNYVATQDLMLAVNAAAALQRPLLVKQFAGGGEGQLILDWALIPPGNDTETCLSILTAWVLAAEQQQLRYGLCLPGIDIAPSSGPAHREHCLEILALF